MDEEEKKKIGKSRMGDGTRGETDADADGEEKIGK